MFPCLSVLKPRIITLHCRITFRHDCERCGIAVQTQNCAALQVNNAGKAGKSYMRYLPISEGSPYVLPIFEKISLRKFSEFPIYLIYLPIWNFNSPYQNSRMPFLFNHSPYLEMKISLFVFWDVSHVWVSAESFCHSE